MADTNEPQDRSLLLRPPPRGQCHTYGCEDDSTMLVQVWREHAGRWTGGVDYCEQHAHEVAPRMPMKSRLVSL